MLRNVRIAITLDKYSYYREYVVFPLTHSFPEIIVECHPLTYCGRPAHCRGERKLLVNFHNRMSVSWRQELSKCQAVSTGLCSA